MGVRGLSRILGKYGKEKEKIEGALYIDGNNLVLWLVEVGDDYETLESKLRRWIQEKGGSRRLVFVFDGHAPKAKLETLKKRSEARGDSAAAFAYENKQSSNLVMACEQAIATVSQMGYEYYQAAAEADDFLVYYGQGSYLLSNDTELAIYEHAKLVLLSTFDGIEGVVWSRRSIADYIFGPEASPEIVIELAFGLGNDYYFETRSNEFSNLIATLVTRQNTRPSPEEIATYQILEAPATAVHLYQYQTELELGLDAAKDLPESAQKAIARILDGDRAFILEDEVSTADDRELATTYQRKCRSLLRDNAIPLAPSKLWHTTSFFIFLQQENSRPASLSATATEWQPVKPTPAADIPLSSSSYTEWQPVKPTPAADIPLSSSSYTEWQPVKPTPAADIPLSSSSYTEVLESHVLRLEMMLVAAGLKPPPRPLHSVVQLPIDAKRLEICQTVRDETITIISAQTGAGKSTRLPLFLLEASSENIIVLSQPRRLATSALYDTARSMGIEAGIKIGGGYSHDEDFHLPPSTRLWFLTAGVAVKLLCYRPKFFTRVTHFIIDETHERDATTDALLALAREHVRSNNRMRLILMSATADVDLLQSYFHQVFRRKPPVVTVPGRQHDLKRYYIDELATDIDMWLGPVWVPPRYNSARATLMRIQLQKSFSISRAIAQAQIEFAEWLVRILVARRNCESIIVFVAGLSEVANLAERFAILSSPTIEYRVLPIHSELPIEVQREALYLPDTSFEVRRVVRIIIATNSAESSLTLPGVDAVIDLCGRKQPTYDLEHDRLILKHNFCCQNVLKQRAGRAGRLKPGVCYHLLPRSQAEKLPKHDPPQILVQPLDGIVLELKAALCESNKSINRLLSQFPTPPTMDQIRKAFTSLIRRGLLKDTGDTFDALPLTPAGTIAAALPLDLRLSHLVTLGAGLKLLDTSLLLAALLSQQASIWLTPLPSGLYGQASDLLVATRQAYLGRRRYDFQRYAEPLAALLALRTFLNTEQRDRAELCVVAALSCPRLRQIQLTLDSLRARVKEIPFLCEQEGSQQKHSKEDTLSRLLLVWTFWDQILLRQASATHKLEKSMVVLSEEVSRADLAPLFPPLLDWRLTKLRRDLRVDAVGVAECIGIRALTREDQDTLWSRLVELATVAGSSVIVALFASTRLVVSENGSTRYDGPAPRKDSHLYSRFEIVSGIRLETSLGLATLTCSSIECANISATLDTFFGSGAKWRFIEEAKEQCVLQFANDPILFNDITPLGGEALNTASAPSCSLATSGKDLIRSALLASSKSKLRFNSGISTEILCSDSGWLLHGGLAGTSRHLPAVLTPSSLEAVYEPSTPNGVAVAAALGLSEGSNAMNEIRARAGFVSVLHSPEWLRLALRAGGLIRAADKFVQGIDCQTLPVELENKADQLAARLHDSIDGGFRTDTSLATDLCQLFEIDFMQWYISKSAHLENQDTKESARLTELVRLLKTPQRGDCVATRFGHGTVTVARRDDSYVVDLGWGIVYGAVEPRLVSRRGMSSTGKMNALPKKKSGSEPGLALLVPSNPSLASRPPAAHEEPHFFPPTTQENASRQEEGTKEVDREEVKRWILQQSSAQSKQKVHASLYSDETEKILLEKKKRLDEFLAFVQIKPAVFRDKPQTVVDRARLCAETNHETSTVIFNIFTQVYGTAALLSSPCICSSCLLLLKDPAAIIRGLIAFLTDEAPSILAKFSLVLKAFYDDDVLDEDTILNWATAAEQSNDLDSRGALKAAEPFVKWLRHADEEDSASSSSSE